MILIVGDIQIQDKPNFLESGKNKLDLFFEVWDQSIDPILEEVFISDIIFTGDIFELAVPKESTRLRFIKFIENVIEKHKDRGLFFHTVTGNHDRRNSSEYYHRLNYEPVTVLSILEERFYDPDLNMSRFNLLESTIDGHPKSIKVGNSYIYGIPYLTDEEEFKYLCNQISEQPVLKGFYKVLIMHQDIKEIISESTISVNDEIFNGIDIIFNGHLHMGGKYTKHGFYLPGSFLEYRIGDKPDPSLGSKGVMLLNPHTASCEFKPIKTPYIVSLYHGDSLPDNYDPNIHLISRKTRPVHIEDTTLIEDNTKDQKLQIIDHIKPNLGLETKAIEEDIVIYYKEIIEKIPESEDLDKNKTRFESIKIAGYRSIVDPIEYNYNTGGSVYIINGAYGSGKTTLILDALHWLLTGKRIKSGAKVNDVVPYKSIQGNNYKGTTVELTLTIRDTKYKIIRGFKSKDTFCDVSIRSDVHLFIKTDKGWNAVDLDTEIPDADYKDLQGLSGKSRRNKQIEFFTGISSDVFLSTIAFSSDSHRLLELTPSKLTEKLEFIFNVKWTAIFDELVIEKIQNLSNQKSNKIIEINNLEQSLKEYKETLKNLRTKFESTHKILEQNVKKAKEDVDKYQQKKKDLEMSLANLETELKNVAVDDTLLQEKEHLLQEFTQSLYKKEIELKELVNKIENSKIYSDKKNSLNIKLGNYSLSISELTRKIKKHEDKLEYLNTGKSHTVTDLSESEKIRTDLTQAVSRYESSIESLQDKLQRLEIHLKELKTKLSVDSDICAVCGEKVPIATDILEANRKTIQTEYNAVQTEKIETERELKGIILTYNHDIEMLSYYSEQVDEYKALINDFDDQIELESEKLESVKNKISDKKDQVTKMKLELKYLVSEDYETLKKEKQALHYDINKLSIDKKELSVEIEKIIADKKYKESIEVKKQSCIDILKSVTESLKDAELSYDNNQILLNREKNNFDADCHSLVSSILDKEENLKLLNKKLNNLTKRLSGFSLLKKKLCGHRGLKYILIKDKLPKLNSILEEVSNYTGEQVIISLNENLAFENKIISRLTEKKVSDLSDGEGDLSNISLLLALSMYFPINVLFIDQPFKNINRENIEKFLIPFQNKAKDKDIHIIAHINTDDLHDVKIVNVYKENEKTKIEL